MNCEICKKKIGIRFLEKIIGTYVKNEKGKRIPICFECQKRYKTKKEIIDAIKA